MRQRFGATLDWRYSEYFLGLHHDAQHHRCFRGGGNPSGTGGGPRKLKNGMTPRISSIQDDRITGVYSVVAGTAYTLPFGRWTLWPSPR